VGFGVGSTSGVGSAVGSSVAAGVGETGVGDSSTGRSGTTVTVGSFSEMGSGDGGVVGEGDTGPSA
jgi:hypothetical protein